MRIGILCRDRRDRKWVRRLREWSVSDDWAAAKYVDHVDFLSEVEGARAWCAGNGNDQVLLAIGCSSDELALLAPENGERRSRGGPRRHVPVIASGGAAAERAKGQSRRQSSRQDHSDPINKLREVIVQRHFRDHARYAPRPITEPPELERYFRLRFKVWDQHGFIPEARRASEAAMEIEHSDRFSEPFGAFTASGALAGCVRLVHSFGKVQPYYVQHIEAIIAASGDGRLMRNFLEPESPWNQPFDILEYFPGFRAYYKKLVTAEERVGEISRVIVDEPHRGNHVAELLVHGVICHARSQQISRLLLACQLTLIPLYEKCGFSVVKELEAIRFGAIPVQSYVMEMQL